MFNFIKYYMTGENILLLFFIFFTIEIYPQWVQTNVNYNYKAYTLAVSETNLFAGSDSGLFRSTDNGSSWTAVNSGLTNNNVWHLAVSPNETGKSNIFAGTWGGGIYRSTDNGTNWYEVNSELTNKFINCLAAYPNETSGTNLFACTFSSDPWGADIFLSTNYGTGWIQINSELMYPFVDAFAVIPSETGAMNLFVAASWGGGLLRFIQKETDWAIDSVLKNLSVYSLAIDGPSLFAGTDHGVLLSTDDGESWAQLNSGLTDTIVKSIAISEGNLFVGTHEDGIFISTNNGASWTEANSGFPPLHGCQSGCPYILDFAFTSSDIFVATFDGVWRRPFSEMITEVEYKFELSTDFILYQNYPNPFNPTTLINYQLAVGSQVTLKIYDVLGKEMVILVNEEKPAGSYEVTWNAKGLPSGVYFYQLKAGKFTATKKLLLMK